MRSVSVLTPRSPHERITGSWTAPVIPMDRIRSVLARTACATSSSARGAGSARSGHEPGAIRSRCTAALRRCAPGGTMGRRVAAFRSCSSGVPSDLRAARKNKAAGRGSHPAGRTTDGGPSRVQPAWCAILVLSGSQHDAAEAGAAPKPKTAPEAPNLVGTKQVSPSRSAEEAAGPGHSSAALW